MRPTRMTWYEAITADQPDLRGRVTWDRGENCDVADVLITTREMIDFLDDETTENVSCIRTWIDGEASGSIWIRLRAEEVAALGECRDDGAHEIGTLLDYLDEWWTARRYWDGWQEVDAVWVPGCESKCSHVQVLTPVGPYDGDEHRAHLARAADQIEAALPLIEAADAERRA